MDGRDDKGRFANGHKGTGGRPRRVTEAEYAAVLRANVNAEDFARIVQSQVQDALHCIDASDRLAAAKFLVGYVIGRPREFVEISSDEDSPLGKLMTRIERSLRNGDDP